MAPHSLKNILFSCFKVSIKDCGNVFSTVSKIMEQEKEFQKDTRKEKGVGETRGEGERGKRGKTGGKGGGRDGGGRGRRVQ